MPQKNEQMAKEIFESIVQTNYDSGDEEEQRNQKHYGSTMVPLNVRHARSAGGEQGHVIKYHVKGSSPSSATEFHLTQKAATELHRALGESIKRMNYDPKTGY